MNKSAVNYTLTHWARKDNIIFDEHFINFAVNINVAMETFNETLGALRDHRLNGL